MADEKAGIAQRSRLVLAHYFGGSSRSWDGVATALGGAFDLVDPSIAGFGGTAAPDGELSLGLYADRLEALADGAPWIAVGHSMGGKIALKVAARRPSALKGLVLIAPSPETPEPMSDDERAETIRRFGDRAAARKHFEDITKGALTTAVFERCVEDEVSVDRRAWMWWLQDGSRRDISGQTRGLTLPTLVIAGGEDKVMPLKTAFEIAARQENAEVRVIEGGGHLLPLEQPGLVADLIRNFVVSSENRQET